jgi:hypothetical protein
MYVTVFKSNKVYGIRLRVHITQSDYGYLTQVHAVSSLLVLLQLDILQELLEK